MPRRLRILKPNLRRSNLKLLTILRSQRSNKRSSMPLRRRRKRTSKNLKSIKTSALRSRPKLLLPHLPSLMPTLPLRTKENTKFKSQTWRTFLFNLTNKLLPRDKRLRDYLPTTLELSPNINNRLRSPKSKWMMLRPKLLVPKRSKESLLLEWRKLQPSCQDQLSQLVRRPSSRRKKKRSRTN